MREIIGYLILIILAVAALDLVFYVSEGRSLTGRLTGIELSFSTLSFAWIAFAIFIGIIIFYGMFHV
jgi:hypothetical protein